jgi:CHAT domain-containing protein
MPGNEQALQLMQQASAAYLGGDSGQALELLDQALAERADDPSLRATMLLQKAEWLSESGRGAAAAAALDEAIPLVEGVPVEGHELEWSGLRSAQAFVARRRGDFSAAEGLYAQAADFAARTPLPDMLLSDIYANQAAVYMETGRLGEAQDILLKALEVDQRTGNKRGESNDLNMLGLVSKRRGDAETAKAYLVKAFTVATEHELVREAANAMSNLGAYLDDEGDHERAASIFRLAAEALGEHGGDESALACSVANQGVALAQTGDLEGAIAMLTRSRQLHLAAANPLHAVADLINLSHFESRLDRRESALEHAEEALRDAQEYGLVEMLWRAEHQVASCRREIAFERARELAAEEDAGDADHSDTGDEEADPLGFGQILDGYRRAIEYIELLRSSVSHVEERHNMLTDKEFVYREAMTTALSLGLGRQALAFSEHARMRSFLDALGSSRVARMEGTDPGAGQRAELTARLLDPLTPADEKPGLMDELRTVRAGMIARQPAVAAVTETELPTVEEILAAIPPETAMLVYYQYSDRGVIIFPLSPEMGLPACQMVSFDEPVERVVRKFRQEIERGDAALETGNLLFAALFRPVMQLLATTQNVIVVPHGALHYVPFSALWFVPAGDDAPPREYLQTRFIQAVAPSASYLAFLSQVTDDSAEYSDPVVLGNPTGDLDGAEREAVKVAATLGATPLIGSAATRQALLAAGSPTVLHVASHGVYDASDPLLSRLEMADGAVTVEDLLTGGPAPVILVLSGCVTGLSDRRPGDELIGLAQAMMRRGTRAVIATLWETFDESSALFFEHLYVRLMLGASVTEAMTWARHLLSTGPGGYDQPVDWAPFVLIGDPDVRIVHPDRPGYVAYEQGERLRLAGDTEGAITAFRQAVDFGNAEVSPAAAVSLGVLLAMRGDADAARAAFQLAFDNGDESVRPVAGVNLGLLLIDQQEYDAARAPLEAAASSDDPEIARVGSDLLTQLDRRAQRSERKTGRLRRVFGSGDSR